MSAKKEIAKYLLYDGVNDFYVKHNLDYMGRGPWHYEPPYYAGRGCDEAAVFTKFQANRVRQQVRFCGFELVAFEPWLQKRKAELAAMPTGRRGFLF